MSTLQDLSCSSSEREGLARWRGDARRSASHGGSTRENCRSESASAAPDPHPRGRVILVEEEIELHRPVLVIIDPLYLAARGARGSDLYEMGSHLEAGPARLPAVRLLLDGVTSLE